MDGYHPPILTTPRNKSFLEENGELPSANFLFLLSVPSNLPNKKFNFKVALKSMCFEVSYIKWGEGLEIVLILFNTDLKNL